MILLTIAIALFISICTLLITVVDWQNYFPDVWEAVIRLGNRDWRVYLIANGIVSMLFAGKILNE